MQARQVKQVGRFLQKLRVEYNELGLDEKQAHPDAMRQFERWFKDALKSGEPESNALVLSTASKQGVPSGRVVLLKDLKDRRFVFFTNYESQKGQELRENPKAAMTFFWPGLQRQVRISGTIKRCTKAESDAYFSVRPRGAQLGATISPQSQSIASREELTELLLAAQKNLKGQNLKRPKHWGGYYLLAEKIEFWQGRGNRLHDRLLYTFKGRGWSIKRLAP
jgi:pyridoxamine 5'-phosphate oxidase